MGVEAFAYRANVYQWQQQKAVLSLKHSVDELPVKLSRHTESWKV